MVIKIIKEPDTYVSPGELARYRQEYDSFMSYYAGPYISLEEYIQRRKREGTELK
jgi:hypothetical protein